MSLPFPATSWSQMGLPGHLFCWCSSAGSETQHSAGSQCPPLKSATQAVPPPPCLSYAATSLISSHSNSQHYPTYLFCCFGNGRMKEIREVFLPPALWHSTGQRQWALGNVVFPALLTFVTWDYKHNEGSDYRTELWINQTVVYPWGK